MLLSISFITTPEQGDQLYYYTGAGRSALLLHRSRAISFITTPEQGMARRLRDWSLITGRGRRGAKKNGKGAYEVLPLQKGGGGGKGFSHGELGAQKVLR